MMKDIERYLKKSKQMSFAMPVKKKKVTKTKRKAKK